MIIIFFLFTFNLLSNENNFTALQDNDLERLEKNLNEQNVNIANQVGQNLLAKAIIDDNLKAVEIILKFKPNLNFAYGIYHWNALHLASYHGLWQMIQNLLDLNIDINKPDSLGNTAFIIACQKNHSKVAEILMNNRCEIGLKNKAGYSAKFYAAGVELFALIQSYEDSLQDLEGLPGSNMFSKLISREARF